MTQQYKFQLQGRSSRYVLMAKGSAAPANFAPVNMKDGAQKAGLFADIAHGLVNDPVSTFNANALLRTVNAGSGVNAPEIGGHLKNALIQGKLSAFKDIPKDTTQTSSETAASVGNKSAYRSASTGTSSKGKTDKNAAVKGSSTNNDRTKKPASEHATCGDPVSMVTGEEILPLQDFELNGLFPLIWRRLYRSSKIKNNVGLGYGWRHSFSVQLIERYQAPPKVGPKQPGKRWFELIDEEGNSHHFDIVKRGQTSYQASSGLALLHDSDGRQVLIRPDESHWVFTKHDESWLLHTVSNELGNELTLSYDKQQRLSSIACTANRGVILSYNASNNIVRIAAYIIDKGGKQQVLPQLLASYQYNDSQSLIASIDSQGAAEQYKYFAGSLLKQRIRASGFSHYFAWTGEGERAKCCRQWGDDGAYDYHFEYNGNKSTSTDSLGNVEHYFHNEQELLTCFIDANGNETQHEYDSQGRKIKTLDAAGQCTAYIYNQAGQLTGQVEADGSRTTYVYNTFGKRIATVDPLGRQFKRQFNASGKLLSETHPDGRAVHYQYNEAGLLSEKTALDGVSTFYQWNDNGELLAEKVGDALTRYSYDSLGRLNAACDAQGLVTEYKRNTRGQVVEQVSYHPQDANPENCIQTGYQYDDAGRLTCMISPDGETTHYSYGGLSQPTKKTFADGSWLNYQYDKERNLIGIERSDECTYQIEYSPTEKPVKITGFDGRVQCYEYDALDNLTAVNDGNERFIKLKRDNRGRIIDQQSVKSSQDSQGTFNSHNFYQYDEIGRVTLAHNSERVVQHQYHLNGLVSQAKQGDWTLDYSFNQQGKSSALSLPDGTKIGYQYNALGQLSGLTLAQAENEKALLALEYSDAGLIKQQTLGNGITLSQSFDVQSRLTDQVWSGEQGKVLQRDYQYDKQNQLTQSSEQTQQSETARSFSYNKLGQLVSSQCKTAEEPIEQSDSFEWDAFGNPKVDNAQPLAERETRVENDRLLSFAGADYSYDKSGNQISCTATGLIQKRNFDGLNQLRQLNSNGKLSQYHYDALGRRSAKITETGKTDFIWDGNQLIGEHTNGQYTWYIYLPDTFLPVALLKDNEIYYYHLDQLGTPICLTDKNQQAVWQNSGDLFGAEEKQQTENAIENPLRFQGQYFDEESGLHYNRFRYYCPKQGRFIHQDPIGLAGGINHYQYAPNPVNWVDPFGLSCKENTWNEFQKDHKGQFSSISEASNAYKELKANESPWPVGFDFESTKRTMQTGETFNMIVNEGMEDLPGQFGTQDNIVNTEYGRQQLAIKEVWKPKLDNVVTYRVNKEFDVYEGPVGPQIDNGKYLKGGGTQITFSEPKKVWSNARPNEFNDFTDEPYLDVVKIKKVDK
ncbi:RHS repeat-associated core domain-containing protein [Psychromonas aquimarina]|uniref:RHS repeat-associated core domain-containing protein n=1 Tax=Psychromonas aquimarina TaxID=444919 RepID=UPI000402F261|nr:RHS repeat-associated core domain-containing protein [Psychromonas aquimarina]